MIDPDTESIKDACVKLVGAKIEIKYTIVLDTKEEYNGKIENCNIVGDCMENILLPFLKKKVPTIREGPKQSSPDFFNKNYEWELKLFNKSPGFDVSNYISYINQLEKNLYKKLYKTQYLIFKYSIEKNHIIIRNFKLFNIWDIVSYSGKYPISLQNKKGTWYNIRPCSFNEMGVNKNSILFIKQICKSISMCPNPIKNREKIIENIKKQFSQIQFQAVLDSIEKLTIN